jgi:hypothetical protein
MYMTGAVGGKIVIKDEKDVQFRELLAKVCAFHPGDRISIVY